MIGSFSNKKTLYLRNWTSASVCVAYAQRIFWKLGRASVGVPSVGAGGNDVPDWELAGTFGGPGGNDVPDWALADTYVGAGGNDVPEAELADGSGT